MNTPHPVSQPRKGFLRRLGGLLLRLTVVLVVIGALVMAGFKLIKHKQHLLAQAPRYGLRPTPVQVVPVRRGTLSETLTYLAVCEPLQQTALSARLTTVVEQINCDEGNQVKAGQVLVTLDDREMRENIAALVAQKRQLQAERAANQALLRSLQQSVAYWQSEARRDQALAARGDIPRAQGANTAEQANVYRGRLLALRERLQALQYQITALSRQQKQLAIKLSYCTLRSPYNGVVARRLVDPGALVVPGKVLLKIEDRIRLKLCFDVPQPDLAKVHAGLPLVFKVAGKPRQARVTHLYPSLEVGRTLRAECLLDQGTAQGLLVGSYVPVRVLVRQFKDVLLVPPGSLLRNAQGARYVFVVRQGKLTARQVTVLGQMPDKAAVQGLTAGELVVTSTYLGLVPLAPGMQVEVKYHLSSASKG